MSNSGLYYIVHWSWNILFNVSPLMWPWKFCACADWQVCTKAGHTKTPFPGISWKSKCTKVKTPVCTPWSWHTMSKHPEFLWRILEKGMHPTFSIDRKPSSVGLRKTTTMLEHSFGQAWRVQTPACRSSGPPKILSHGPACKFFKSHRLWETSKFLSDKDWCGRVLIRITSRDQWLSSLLSWLTDEHI